MDMPDPALILLIGPSGAGKSTWAGARFLDEEIVSSDRLRAMVGSGEADLDASEDAFDLLRQIVARRIERGLTTVVDTVGLDADLRAWAHSLAHEHGLPAVAVVFATPRSVCRERNRDKNRPVPVRVIDGQHRRTRDIGPILVAEGWDTVVEVPFEGENPPVVRSSPGPIEGALGRPESVLRFVLHVSRFDWDEPLGPRLAGIARAAESTGFAGISVMDHLVQIPQVGRVWEDMPESLGTLGFLCGVTESIEVGPLVLNTTLRNPALVAKSLATLDALSGGRIFCGIGAGWYEDEERAYGYAPLAVSARLDRLEDAAGLLPMMWARGTATYHGRSTEVVEAMTYPRPARPIPVIIGGGGEKRTLRIAARHADAVNVIGGIDVIRRKMDVLRRHCREVGRDPKAVGVTVLDVALLGRNRREVTDLVERHRGRSRAAAYRARVGAGTVEELIARYTELASVGVGTVFVTMPNLAGPDEVVRFADIVAAFGQNSGVGAPRPPVST